MYILTYKNMILRICAIDTIQLLSVAEYFCIRDTNNRVVPVALYVSIYGPMARK
jgi:hypothetical protein